MSSSHKSDRYNIPQFPGGAIIPTLDLNYTDATLPADQRYEDGLVVMTLTGGDVEATHLNGTQVLYAEAPAYFIIPGRVRSVDGNTTADVVAYV